MQTIKIAAFSLFGFLAYATSVTAQALPDYEILPLSGSSRPQSHTNSVESWHALKIDRKNNKLWDCEASYDKHSRRFKNTTCKAIETFFSTHVPNMVFATPVPSNVPGGDRYFWSIDIKSGDPFFCEMDAPIWGCIRVEDSVAGVH